MPLNSLSTITGLITLPKDPNLQNDHFQDTGYYIPTEYVAGVTSKSWYNIFNGQLLNWTIVGDIALVLNDPRLTNIFPTGITRILSLRGISYISQNVYMNKGTYTISFYATGRTNSPMLGVNYNSLQKLKVYIGGTLKGTYGFSNIVDNFQTGAYTIPFIIASGGTYEIKFSTEEYSASTSDIFLTKIFIT